MDKIKLSEIRAKFPMYSDMSDEDLIIGLRKKYYPDIPAAKFYERIQWDNVDPTEGMSGTDKFLAGAGKAITDVGRGLGQMVGLVGRDDVAESRKLDAPLMATGAGTAGNIAGNIAALLPTAMIPGAATLKGAALIGAGTGLAAPSESTLETLKNTGLGAALAPAANIAGRGIGALAQGGKALIDPFTKAGQDRMAARTLQQFAADPTKAAQNLRNAQSLVPGSIPTMAQASDDAGLAQLERTLRNNPETAPAILAQLNAQRAARLDAVQNIAGDDAYYNAIKEGRSIFAAEDYAKAVAQGFDTKALSGVQKELDRVLARPLVQDLAGKAKAIAANNDEALTELGSIRGVDYLIKALDNEISKAKGAASSIGKEELRSLTKTKADLLDILKKAAPAYTEARENFAGMSRQVNSMDVARDLLDRMQSPLARAGASGRELKNEYARALENATESVKRQTGMDLPLEAIMPKRDLDMLQNVARDMARAANADDLGRAVGSNTAQNLSAQNLLRRVLGPTGLPESWAESNMLQAFLSPYTGIAKLAGSERAVMDRLSKAAIDPQDAAMLLLLTQQPSTLGMLGAQSLRYAPAIGLLGNAPE